MTKQRTHQNYTSISKNELVENILKALIKVSDISNLISAVFCTPTLMPIEAFKSFQTLIVFLSLPG